MQYYGSFKNVSKILSPDETTPNLLYTFSNKDIVRRTLNVKQTNEYLIHQRKKRKYFEKMKILPKNRNKHDLYRKAMRNAPEAKIDEELEEDIECDKIDIGLDVFAGLNEPTLDLPDMIRKEGERLPLYLGDGQIINTMSDRLNFLKCMIQKYNKKGSIGKMDENKLIKRNLNQLRKPPQKL